MVGAEHVGQKAGSTHYPQESMTCFSIHTQAASSLSACLCGEHSYMHQKATDSAIQCWTVKEVVPLDQIVKQGLVCPIS